LTKQVHPCVASIPQRNSFTVRTSNLSYVSSLWTCVVILEYSQNRKTS